MEISDAVHGRMILRKRISTGPQVKEIASPPTGGFRRVGVGGYELVVPVKIDVRTVPVQSHFGCDIQTKIRIV